MNLKFPLTHTYKNDFENHSQVIKIPQYSTANIEKDLFHKKLKDGLGGIIAIMANAGFNFKGYIVDPSSDIEAFEIDDCGIKKSKSGVIFGLANYSGNIARKVFDIKFTTAYPTITLPLEQNLFVVNSGVSYLPGRFQHITIPPDLNLHLTNEKNKKDYIFFKNDEILFDDYGVLKKDFIKLITVTYQNIDNCPIFTNKKYKACFMMAFAKMKHWNNHTHFSMEIFALKEENIKVPLDKHKKGELGVLLPMHVEYKNIETDNTIRYFLQPFIIINHDNEKFIKVKFW